MYTDFLSKKWNSDCMGCGIASYQATPPFGLIYETDHFVLHQDPLIPLEGFLILATKRHIKSIEEMNDSEYLEFSMLVRKIRLLYPLKKELLSLTLIQEEHSKHFHLWFFPWYKWMKISQNQPKLSQIRGIMDDLVHDNLDKVKLDQIEGFITNFRKKMGD